MINEKLNLSVYEPTITQISAKQKESGRVLHMKSEIVEDGTLKVKRADGTTVSISASSGASGSGTSPLSIDAETSSSVTALDLYGKSSQASYSDVLSSLSLAGSTSQTTYTGYNLLPTPVAGDYSSNGATITVTSDGWIELSGTTESSVNVSIPLVETGTYPADGGYIHLLNTTANASVAPSFELSSSPGTTNVAPALSPTNRIYTIPSARNGLTYDRIRFWIASGVDTTCKFRPMICESNAVVEYQAYVGGTTPNPSYPQDIVGVGQYDKMVVLDGSETWSSYTYGDNVRFAITPSTYNVNYNGSNTLCACDALKCSYTGTVSYVSDATEPIVFTHSSAIFLTVTPDCGIPTTTAEAKTYFASNPIKVWYQSTDYTATSDVYFVTTFTDSNSNFVKSIGTTTASPHLYEGDTFDFCTGTLTRNKALATLDGSTNKIDGIYNNGVAYSTAISGIQTGTNETQNDVRVLCDSLVGVSYLTIQGSGRTDNTIAQNVGVRLNLYISSYTTATQYNTYLSDNPMKFLYIIDETTSTLPLSDTFYFRSGEYTFSGDGTLTATYSGTAPSPNYPVEIVSVENPSVSVYGKNIFDISTATIYGRYISYSSPTSAQWKTSGDSGSYAWEVQPNSTYTIKVHAETTVFRVCALNVDPTTVGSSTVNTTNAYSQNASTNFYCTITTASDERWLVVQLSKAVTNARNGKVQIEVGSTATDYEAYVAPTTYSLTGTLYAIPTTNSALANYTDSNSQMWIADVWDVVSGTVTRRLHKYTRTDISKSLSSTYKGSFYGYPYSFTPNAVATGNAPLTFTPYCNALTYAGQVNVNYKLGEMRNDTSYSFWVHDGAISMTDLDNLLDEIGFYVILPLATPTTESVTANTITLAEGTNTIVYADDNSLGDYMEVSGDYGENIAKLTETALSVKGKAYCSLEYTTSNISTFPFIINVLEGHDAT